jgi:hypothetical protein
MLTICTFHQTLFGWLNKKGMKHEHEGKISCIGKIRNAYKILLEILVDYLDLNAWVIKEFMLEEYSVSLWWITLLRLRREITGGML